MSAGRHLRVTIWNENVHEQRDDTVKRIYAHGMHGAIADGLRRELGGGVSLRFATYSKIFRRLMGTSCTLRWRSDEGGEREVIWTVDPGHPIAAGVPQPIVIPHQEMYGEFFDIPPPDELVFISSFECGEVFRSGCCYQRGAGRVVYFSPGDQVFPVYHQAEIQRVIANCVAWCGGAAPANDVPSKREGNARRSWYLNDL